MTSLQHDKMVYANDIMHINIQMKAEIYIYIYIYIYMQGLDWSLIAHIYVYIPI